MDRRNNWLYFFGTFLRIKIVASLGRRAIRRLFGPRPPNRTGSLPQVVPKTIWIFWDQGEAAAPDIVKACISSWRGMNPGWKVRVLDKVSGSTAVDLPDLPEELPVQAFADLLRLRLLRQHGGVWADATVYCLKPLDHWLPFAAQRGFFAFSWTRHDKWFLWPGVARPVGNWFLASVPEGRVVSAWEGYSFEYWKGRQKAHVYFWPHMIFAYLQLASRAFRESYEEVPKVGCLNAHLIYDSVLRRTSDEAVIEVLQAGAAPVQKLRWDWQDDDLVLAKRLLRRAGARLEPEPAN